jgi:hypothetical protein
MDEMKSVDLGDKRLNTRLQHVLSQLSARPTASIPAACGGHAEMTAAYRLFDNEKVGFDDVLRPHRDATRRRIAEQATVLMVQDTTEGDLTRPRRQVVGAGPLDDGPRRGFFLHLLHAFTPDGTPLGTVHARAWVRTDGERSAAGRKRSERAATPIEDKESYRWVEALRQVREEAERQPGVQFVAIADSEADIYEVLAEAQAEPQPADWIVRACQDRAVQRGDEATAAASLRAALESRPVSFTQTIRVRGREPKMGRCEARGRRQPRRSRTAEVEVRAATVTLRPPWRSDRKLPAVTINAVLVREVAPPAGEPTVEWLLLTSLPIDTSEQIRQVIEYYCVRWMAEVFFRTLKSGCRVERRRFEDIDRVLPCVAVYLIVAWRTLYVCRLGRGCPDIDCEAVFEPSEWKSVWKVVRRREPPRQPPKLREMVRLVAQLGGYVNRPKAGPPGPQTVWLGLQRTHDLALCWDLFGPGARKPTGDV